MSKLTRRQLLVFFGASAGTTILAPVLGEKLFGNNPSVAQAVEPLKFTPVRLPHPLPIYQQQPSFLATGNGEGQTLNPSEDTRLTSYTVLDDVVVPPEYERYVIISWGDRVFPNQDEYFGFNNDFTGFIPIDGTSPNDGYLWVNHEYVSYPLTLLTPEASNDLAPFPTAYELVVGGSLPSGDPALSTLGQRLAALTLQERRELYGEFLYNMGGSIVRISRLDRGGRFAVVSDPKNRRLHTLSGLGINSQRTDAYQSVTSWGQRSYQQGDQNYLIGTGPAATQVFSLSSDGLGNRIIGTGHNCSGGVSPWGTILSGEENFQASSPTATSTGFFVGVTENVGPNGTQTGYNTGTTGAEFGLVGEKYGWITEADPADPNFRPRKHTALGRFRWENIALRVEAGNGLVTYMGDDRRGGHTWKFVSRGTVSSPTSKDNSALFEDGTLYAARYNADGTGQWIPLYLDADTNPTPPSTLASVEIASLGRATNNGLIRLPRRNGIAGQTADGGAFNVITTNEATALPGYQGKKLSDFYTSQGAVLVDAFLAANLIGATPTARPEDLEVNPRNPNEVFIAYTDGAPGSDGYPDSRIFVVSKYSSAVNAAQPSGELFKITEDSSDGTGNTFRWQRFAKGGEAGAEIGSGFANIDNLAFDSQGNIWGVTDMSTNAHNGFNVGAAGNPTNIDHRVVGAVVEGATSDLNVETSALVGVFGNNWLFYIPTTGPDAGEVFPFAYGPPRCEMTGPAFVGDTLILAVQHPGEQCPFSPQVALNRDIEMLNLDGSLFTQNRSVPRGSNWPNNLEGDPQGPPRPSVIGIRRKQSSDRFV